MVLADACFSTETTLQAGSSIAAVNNATEAIGSIFLLACVTVFLLGLAEVIGQSGKKVVMRKPAMEVLLVMVEFSVTFDIRLFYLKGYNQALYIE